jgi:hypothetical protein
VNCGLEDQLALKQARVLRARDDINESMQRGWAQLEALVKPKENSIAVFNSLSWARSGLVETDLPADTTISDPATGANVPFEILWKGKGIALPGFGPGKRPGPLRGCERARGWIPALHG